MIYILNSPVMPNWGIYDFQPLDLEEAKGIVQNNDYISAIGHESTARLLSALLEVPIQVNRIRITMETGDRAIVFLLASRPPELKIYNEEELKEIGYEFGYIERIE